MSTTHPPLDTLLQCAAGAVDSETVTHVEVCSSCRQRLGELRGFLHTVRDELLEMRPECPTPDELARLPPGAEHDDPHLMRCPLCREEVKMLFEVESTARLGSGLGSGLGTADSADSADSAVGELPAGGLFYRPSPVVSGGDFAYQRGAEPAEWVIQEGAEKELRVAGATVSLRCTEGELVVHVAPADGPLTLALSNELLEKRIPLVPGEQRIAVGGWERVRVVAGGGV